MYVYLMNQTQDKDGRLIFKMNININQFLLFKGPLYEI